MNKIRLLQVDNSISSLHAATGFLAEFKDLDIVGTAQNGNDALSQAADLQPDVVLLDVDLPGINGIETTPRLRKIMPEVGIIVLSLYNYDIYKEAALVAGADDFIPKDTLVDKLIPAIHRVSLRNERLAFVE